MRTFSRKYIIILIIFITPLFIISCNSNSNSNNSLDGERIQGDTYVAIGYFDENNQIIDNGSNIDVTNNNSLTHILDIDQKLEEDREYLLIALSNFQQINFKVNDKTYDYYKFKLKKIDSCKLKIDITLPNNSKELDYILIKKPFDLSKDFNLDEIMSLQDIICTRFKVNNASQAIDYCKDTQSVSGEIDNIWISDEKNVVKALHTINKNKKLYLGIGNDTKSKLDYAVILFNNWKQVRFDDGDLVKYFKLSSNDKKVYELNLSSLTDESYFQAICFPFPFNVDTEEPSSTQAFGSSKSIISSK